MHVIYVGYWYDDDFRSVDEFFARCPTTHDYPAAIAAAGTQVTVIQRFGDSATVRRDGVTFRFVADHCRPRLRWQVPHYLHSTVASVCAESENTVLHVNSLIFPLQVRALRRRCPRTPIVVQHHAEVPWPGAKSRLQKYGLRSADGFLFASAGLAQDWITAGVITATQSIYEVMESPPSLQARLCLRSGALNLLWVGRLTPEKDPLTILAAFENVLQHVPAARLEMVYQGGELTDRVRQRIANSTRLRGNVSMIGAVPHCELHTYYERAHLFVVGSRREGSGYALAEAMAHGTVPVVPRIPSYRRMTSGAGYLWEVGDVGDCTRAMLEAIRAPFEPQRDATLVAYRTYLSPAAVAEHAITAYDSILATRSRK